MPTRAAIAIGAHPDDIEFLMAGTLLLLKQTGYETHYLSLASGNCGTVRYGSAKARAIRKTEARRGAKILGAEFHPCMTDDLEIVYSVELLRKVAAIVREVQPTIVLTHSPQDYMEDHMTTSRLAVTAAFARGMPNFRTVPARRARDYEVTVYHSMPHGLRDGLGQVVMPGAFVDTTTVQAKKLEALAAHKSQQGWLDVSQKMDSYLATMEDMSREVGRISGMFIHAEGWRRHSHLGFCEAITDPLKHALGKRYFVNKRYQKGLG